MEKPPTLDSMIAQEIVSALEAQGHEQWRETRKQEDGTYAKRLKRLDPAVDAAWMEKHPELVVEENGRKKVDIANLSFNELPPSRQEDSRASLRYAAESVLRASANGTSHDETFIDATADTIHERWVLRNRESVLDEIDELREFAGESGQKDIETKENQLLPYNQLATDFQKELDRKYVRLALKAYERYQASNT